MLEHVDVLVIDLQDAGARYYTYPAAVATVMEAAAAARLSVIVLDRPNPIGGTVQGDVQDSVTASAVARFPIAMRHGMTIGELARLARKTLGLRADLRVVPLDGWRRSMDLDATGLPFVPPSLNLRTLESLYHYPGLCIFEGTNLSVGRGSDHPFEQVGAPWLDTAAVLARLRRAATARCPLHRHHVHPSLTGRRKVCRHAPVRHPSHHHGPNPLRSDRHCGPSSRRAESRPSADRSLSGRRSSTG